MVQRTLFFSIFFLSTLCLFFSFLYKNRGEWTHELTPLWENQLVYRKKKKTGIGLKIGWYINWQKKKEKTTWIRRENSDLWVGWWYRHIHLSSLYLWYWCFSHLPMRAMNSFKETRKQIPVAIERQNFSLFHSP